MIKVTLLYGGLFSTDGVITSAGMGIIEKALNKLPRTTVRSYLWGNTQAAYDDILNQSKTDKTVVVGYSGGGMAATYIANMPKVLIDLMICYDPSPWWNMKAIGANVKKAVCYQNSSYMIIPFVGGLSPKYWQVGGGKLEAKVGGPKVEVIPINENHLAVQYDQHLHDLTLSYVKALDK